MSNRLSVFLSYGFRPFFLFGPAYAAVAMIAWMAWIGIHAAGGQIISMSTDFPPFRWHAHEMLFGYGLAIITGFFLTAVPSWTASKPISGKPLGALVLLWLAGRVVIWFSASLPPVVVASVDMAYIPFLMVLVFPKLMARKTPRNLIFLPILAALFVANTLVHLERMDVEWASMETGHWLALDILLMMIVIIGGRIIPAFTTNTLRKLGEDNFPVSDAITDKLAILSIIALAVADVADFNDTVTGWLALFAAVINAWRLSRWRGLKVLNVPIMWIVHLGYLWLVIGLALRAAALLNGFMNEATAAHALTVGCIGSMTIGVLTRASLGHTGREIKAPGAMVLAYLLISVAAASRIIGPAWLPQFYNESMIISGISWSIAFLIIATINWPILTKPRWRVAG